MSYNAFVSYNRQADGELAPKLRSALHSLASPWYWPRALRIFLDTAALPAVPGLSSALKAKLADSEHFVLLASPKAAQSDWVRQEVQWWLDHKALDKLVLVLTDGHIVWDKSAGDFDWSRTTALPAVLRGRYAEEPGYVKLDWARGKEKLSLDEPKFRRAVLDIAAPLHGKDKDLLDGEDVVQYRRRMRLARSAVVALALLFIAASVAAFTAWQQRETARSRELAASAVAQLAVDPELSILLAREAVRIQPNSIDLGLSALVAGQVIRKEPTLQAGSALRRALQESHLRITVADSDNIREVGPDGRLAIERSSDGTLSLWELRAKRKLRELAESSEPVTDAAFTPDGGAIVTFDRLGMVRIRDGRTGDLKVEFPRHAGPVTAFGFGVYGRALATASADGVVRIWRTATGQSFQLETHGERFDGIGFSTTGMQVVVAWNRSGVVRLWDIRTGKSFLGTVELPDNAEADETNKPVLEDVAVSTKGLVLLRRGDGALRVYDPGTDKDQPLLRGDTEFREAVFSPDTRWIATVRDIPPALSPHSEVLVLNTATQEPVARLSGHVGRVREAVFSPDSRLVVTAGSDHTVRVWRAENGETLAVFRAEDDFYYPQFTNNGRFVVTHSMEGRVRVWEIPGSNTVFRHHAHDGVVRSVDFSPKAMRFLTTGGDAAARLWDAETGAELKALRGHADIVIDGRFSADGRRVITAGNDHIVRVWDVDSGDMKLTIPHPSPVGSAGFSADGALIATGSEDGHVRVWRAEGVGSRPWRDLQAHQGEVNGVAFTPTGGHGLASVGGDGWLRYWDADTGNRRWERPEELRGVAGALQGNAILRNLLSVGLHGIQSVSFSSDGSLVVTSHGDALLRTWTTAKGEKTPWEFAAPSGLHMTSAEFSPNGKFLLGSGGDGKARIWEVATGRLIRVLGEDGETVNDASFSPDSRSVVAGSMNGDVAVYACEICGSADDLLALAADRVTRALKPEERVRFLHESAGQQ